MTKHITLEILECQLCRRRVFAASKPNGTGRVLSSNSYRDCGGPWKVLMHEEIELNSLKKEAY